MNAKKNSLTYNKCIHMSQRTSHLSQNSHWCIFVLLWQVGLRCTASSSPLYVLSTTDLWSNRHRDGIRLWLTQTLADTSTVTYGLSATRWRTHLLVFVAWTYGTSSRVATIYIVFYTIPALDSHLLHYICSLNNVNMATETDA